MLGVVPLAARQLWAAAGRPLEYFPTLKVAISKTCSKAKVCLSHSWYRLAVSRRSAHQALCCMSISMHPASL